MLNHEPDDTTAGIPLTALVADLRSRREAVASLYGGSTYYGEDLELFRSYAAEHKCFLEQKPEALSRAPDDEGNEHQVWYQQDSARYLKATWPDFFGLLVVYRSHEDHKASPIDYLERWLLHNELFGDDVRFVGALLEGDQLRLVISQPAIAGVPATLEQISDFFTNNGWYRFTVGKELAFYEPERQVAISDTHRGNIILMDDGLLAPIDLRVQPMTGALLDQVEKLCGL